MTNGFVSQSTKRKLIFISIILIIVMAYFYYPRSIKQLCINKNLEVEGITVLRIATSDREQETITLSDENKDLLLDILNNHYARRQVIKTKYVNDESMGYFIFIEYLNTNRESRIFFFAEDIINVNNDHYRIYGDSLAREFCEVVESQISSAHN